MRDIQQEIRENLDRIEEKHNVRILMAAESGSRAWGFASPDSDYDVRFIYMRKLNRYLCIEPVRDVIEWQLDEVLDINGWDLKKALQGFAKGNPNLTEWADSPIIYRKAECWDALYEVARQYFSEKTALCHYYGTAKNTYLSFLTKETVRYKKYFYALRPLLCCRWIERYHESPPVLFSELMRLFEEPDEVFPEGLYEQIQLLLERKTVTEEKDLNPQMPVIRDFIKEECIRQKEISFHCQDDHEPNIEPLNNIFRKTVCGDRWST